MNQSLIKAHNQEVIKAAKPFEPSKQPVESQQLTEKELNICKNIKLALAIAFSMALIGAALDLLV